MAYSFERHRITGGIGADDPFWRALEDGELRLCRCAGCATWVWPAHFRCGACGGWDMDWPEVAARGRVFSWTRSWYAFERVAERAADLPYVTIVAELPEADGARVMGVLCGDETGLRVGAAVTGKILPPSETTKFYPSIVWELDTTGRAA